MARESIDLESTISNMLERNLVVGPPLESAGVGGIDAATYAQIDKQANNLVQMFWPIPISVADGDGLVPTSVIVHAMTDTITSSAAYLTHLKLGHVVVDEMSIQLASRLLEEFGKTLDASVFQTVILMVTGYDNCLTLHHYGQIRRDQFISGELHRPWSHYTLEGELNLLIALGAVVVERDLDVSFVKLTEYGHQRFTRIRDVLSRSGFLARRAALMRMSEFSQLADYDALVDRLADMNTARRMLLAKSEIEPGMRVLELGCGTGSLTVDAGLYERVGSTGEVIATDPTFGMLMRAKRKVEMNGISNVTLIQSHAEELDFKANTFDAVIGCSFLHFTDIPATLREVHRVAKPGAVFATYFPLDYSRSNLFFQEWFVPVIAGISENRKQERLPHVNEVPDAMMGLYTELDVVEHGLPIDHRNPEDVVRFFVQVANVFESAFENLPWHAKHTMLNNLVERGRYITSNYPAEDLIQIHPHQLIRAKVQKP